MAKQLTIDFSSSKTYATEANLVRAVEKATWLGNSTYIVMMTPEGRFTPVFLFKRLENEQLAFHVANNGWHVLG